VVTRLIAGLVQAVSFGNELTVTLDVEGVVSSFVIFDDFKCESEAGAQRMNLGVLQGGDLMLSLPGETMTVFKHKDSVHIQFSNGVQFVVAGLEGESWLLR